ncbi:hypothetical protein E4S40_01700 [Algoriphagus kandeliae]|uniref:Uncharacterized protein n=1 Tax=Algoriphagus kandeliae TaxID=2562278 RepID=A0A4Y9R1Z7_9BACT|nr:hypothetical protein [Algoriphagus kandeliae]TFV97396.1 hypothetical protein E4S40_01700 [Algoriphagus kandeliae]
MRFWFFSFLVFIGLVPMLSATQSAKLKIWPLEFGDTYNFDRLSPYFSEAQLDSLLSNPFEIAGAFELMRDESGIYAFSSCYLDVYQWTAEGWKNLYGFDNKGYTCGAKYFVREGSIYSLGGYGFWRNHLDLLSFDKETGSWSLMTPKNQPIDFAPGIAGLSDKGILVLLPFEENLRQDKKGEHGQGFFLDLDEMAWKYLSLGSIVSYDPFESQFVVDSTVPLDTEDYLAFACIGTEKRRIGFLIMEKSSLEIRFFRLEKGLDFVFRPTWLLQVDNLVSIQTYMDGIQEFDLDDFFRKGEFVGKAEILPISPDGIEELKRDYVLIISCVLIVTGIVLFFMFQNAIKKQKAAKTFSNGTSNGSSLPENMDNGIESNGWIHQFHPFKGRLLTVEELDKVLNIDHLPNPDNKKVRRSRLIKEVNQHSEQELGYTLITRKKNPEDKRYLLYEINGQE